MFGSLQQKFRDARSEPVKCFLAVVLSLIVIVLGILATARILGFGSGIENNRGVVSVSALAVAFLLGLGYEVWRLTGRLEKKASCISDLESKVENLEESISSLEKEKSFLSRLMEGYKNYTHDEVLKKLHIILNTLDKKEEWEKSDACVDRVKVKPDDTPDGVDIKHKVSKLADVMINIGKDSGVSKGVIFRVVDPSSMELYGKIEVVDVSPKSAVCRLSPDYNSVFWSEIEKCVDKNSNCIIGVTSNLIKPDIPDEFEDIDTKGLEKLNKSVESISSTKWS